jgi:uncharacterized HAD superfamily protein
MKIGLDFDGVITDSDKLKAELAFELFGKKIKPEQANKKYLFSNNVLTKEEYTKVQQYAYINDKFHNRLEEIPGAIAGLRSLLEKHEIKIITSRDGEALRLAKEWLKARDIECEMSGMGYGVSKHSAMTGEDVFVDDDLPKLEQLKGVVGRLILFNSRGIFAEESAEDILVERVSSWDDLLKVLPI